MSGVPANVIEREKVWIGYSERSYLRSRTERFALTVAVPFIGYLLLSSVQPTVYGEYVWIGLAFLAMPIATAVLLAKTLKGFSRGYLFVRGFLLAGLAMAAYTAFNLIVVRNRIAEVVNPAAVMEVGAFVTLIFGLVAGLVAGAFSALLAKGVSA